MSNVWPSILMQMKYLHVLWKPRWDNVKYTSQYECSCTYLCEQSAYVSHSQAAVLISRNSTWKVDGNED